MQNEQSAELPVNAPSIPDYQKAACELAAAGWQELVKAQYTGDAGHEDAARRIMDRAVGLCRGLGAPTTCPDQHPWCPCR